MNKYAFDLDDDEDEDDYGAAPKAGAGKGKVSSAPTAVTRAAPSSSKAPPAPVRYSSSVDLLDSANPVKTNSLDTMSVKKAFADRDLVTHEENLGFSFYSTPWVIPDIDKAAMHRMSSIFKEGRAPMDQCVLTEDLSIGVGLNLYFQFAISIAIGMVFVSIFALPTLVFAYSGQAVGQQDRDIIGLYALTIANIGHDPNSLTYTADSACVSSGGATPTYYGTCVNILGSLYTIEKISFAITVAEILQILAFFLMILHLQRRFKKITSTHIDTGVPSITDYAVHITNIPPDTTVEELVNHFSELYQLEAKDFRGRLPVEDAAPVDSTGYSGNELYVGTWVAECTICSKMGKIVTYLERRKELMKKLYHSRARMKMYGPKTPHIKGFDIRKYLAEEKVMLRLAAKLDKLNEKIHMNYEPEKDGDIEKGEGEDGENSVHSRPSSAGKPSSRPTTPVKSKKGLKGAKGAGALATKSADEDDTSNPFPTPTRAKSQQKQSSVGDLGSDKSTGLQRTRSFREKINGLLTDAPALAAFVCFEYNESFARCVEDHAFWSYYPMRLCYPSKMLFKGRVLHVTRAPEPDQIVWENIEIGRTQKLLARARTIFLIVAVLIIVYALFAAAADARSKYVALTPPIGLCNRALPELYAGSSYSNDTYLSHMVLSRPPNEERATYDAQCDAVLPDSYYVEYTWENNLRAPIGSYSLSACDVSAADIDQLCPANGQSTFCPCLPRNAGGQCESMGCAADNPDSCVKFTTADALNCYCSGQVDTMLGNGGVGYALSWVVTSLMGAYPDASDECVDTKYYLGASSFALYLAIIVTLISNKVLKGIVIRNAQAEHHVSFDELNRSIASKIFIATYLNMAIMILLAYGYSTESPPVLTDNYLFSGPSKDFDRGWYRTVGFYLVVTFLLMNFPQFVTKYYNYYVSIRFKKFAAYKEVTEMKGKKYPTQYSLNALEVDNASLDVRVRCGQTLAWVFTAMTFGAGVPILLPLCAAALIFLCRMDKFMFCRFYKLPKPSSVALIQWVLCVLPYAALIRLAFSMFILSADNMLPETWPSVQTAEQSAGGYSASVVSFESYESAVRWLKNSEYISAAPSWITRRLLRVNTLPLLVLMIVILVAKALRRVWDYLPPVIFLRHLWTFIKFLLGYSRYRASRTPGFIHPYDLTFHTADPLRNQEASLSGGYMKYLRHKDDKPFTWYSLFCFCWRWCYPPKDTPPELGSRWEILEYGDYDVKIKTWPATMQLAEGSIKMTGDQKYTFDLICEQYCNSYNLENIPAYKTVGLTLRKEPFIPIVPAYMKWREAFEKENNLTKPVAVVAAEKRPKFTLGDEDEEKGNDADDEPATMEEKSKGVLKGKGNIKKGKIVPTANDKHAKDDPTPPAKSGLKKTVSFMGGGKGKEKDEPKKVDKKTPAPAPGKKKVVAAKKQESSSSSSSGSGSSSDSSSESGSGSGSGSSSSSGSGSSSSDSDN